MLSDHQCELLTSWVDGELDARGRQAVSSLLASSPEAREFLGKLEADSKELHNLPSHKAPETLAETVMVTVNDNVPRPARGTPLQTPVSVPAKGIPSWLGLAAAACVLATVSVGTFFLSGGLLHNRTASEAKLDPFLSDLFGSSALRFGEDVKEADVGVRLAVADMREEPVKRRLANELKEKPGVWFDVPAAKNNLAVDRLSKAFRENGITVLVDPVVKDNLKKREKVKYVLYAENLSQDEVAKILENISVADLKAKESKALQECVRMTAISVDNRAQLAKALGVDPKQLEPPLEAKLPMAIGSSETDPTKEPGRAKTPPRFAMLMTLDNGDGKASEQLRQFLAARQGLQHGMVQMVLMIHEEQGL